MKNISRKTTSHYNPLVWLLAFLLSMSLLSNRVNAQVSALSFTNTLGSWSSNLITTAGGATLLTSTSSTDDDVQYPSSGTNSLGFTFTIGGVSYTTFSASSNGYLQLGGNSGQYNYSYSTSYAGGYFELFGGDLQGSGLTTSTISYQVLGTSPNRVFVIQWRDWSWYTGNSTSNLMNGQIRLGEDGSVRYVYGNCTPTGSYTTSTNFTGASTTDYAYVTGSTWTGAATTSTTSSTTMTWSSTVKPDSGRTYAWATLPQVFDSASTIQVTGGVPVGGTAQPVIGIVFYTHGALNAKTVSAILCNTTGTTSTSDISNAKIYYTGNTNTFTTPSAALHQFGSTTFTSPSGAMYFTGLDTLKPGANYFWLVYDITSSTSSMGNVVDGQCTLVTDSSTHAPNTTNPAGNRPITGPMSGTYTINPTGTGANNFTSINAAITGLQNRTVVGPVTFILSAATYTYSTPLILPCITGASATNTITFDGGNGNAASRVITGSIASSDLVYVSCSYYTLRNLTVTNSYSSGCGGIGIVAGSNGVTINNCIVSTGSASSTSSCINTATSTSDYYGSGSTTLDSLTIDSNNLSTAYYGITLYGSSSATSNRNFKIRNNTITNIYYMAAQIEYIYAGYDFNYNTATMSSSYGYYGYYLYFNQNASSVPTNIIGNKIMGSWGYPMYIYYPGGSTTSNYVNVYNNMIVGGNNASYPYDYYGLYFYNTNSYSRIYHNTISLPYSYSSSSYAGMYLAGSSYTSVKNNVIVNTASSGSACNVYCGTAILNDSLNYNVYYNASNTSLVYNNGTYTTPSNFNTPSAGGDSSVNQLPAFVSLTDLHLTSGCSVPSGANLTTMVPTDFDRATRPATPRRGCVEASFLTVDLAMNAIVSPVSPVGTGTASVSVKFQNMGTTTLSAATVSYQFNGGTPVTTSWTGSMGLCGSAVVAFSTPVTLVSTNTLKVWVTPASGTDLNHNNDTINAVINASMAGGVYTINGSSPTSGTNFQTFAAAVSAMGSGILGSVVFNVASGTYTQSASLIIPVIPGASATKTITFEGGNGNAATRIVTGNISSAALVYISSPYITFRNLSFSNTYTSNSGVIGILATGTGVKISNCLISSSNTSSTGSNIYLATSTTDYYGSGGVGTDSLTIDSNTLTGSYYGMYLYGTSSAGANRNFKVRYNTINGPYYMGVYLYYIYNNIDFLYNNVVMSPTLYGYYGVYMYYCTNGSSLPTNVIGNKIKNPVGYGFYCYYPGGSTAANSFNFYNNMIIMGNNSSYPYDYYGMYLYNGNSYNQIYHNSILVPISYSSTSYTGMYLAGNSYYSVKNNIIVNTASSGSACNMYCGTSVPNDSINFNVYYNNSNANVVYNGGAFSTSSTFNTTSNGGDSSVYLMPSFVANLSDLHLSGPCSVPVGKNITGFVPTDIDGVTRNNPPRRGCSEPSFVANDLAMDSLTSPIPPITSGAGASVTVRIKNTGSTPIYSALVYYQFNGGTPIPYAWSGTLATCGSATVTFGTGVTLGSVNSFKVWTALPNGSADGNRLNDTLNYTYFTPLSGTFTINNAAPTAGTNFNSFATAIATVKSAGMAGAVKFNVLAGTYNENPIITGPITGLSAVNTLTFDGGNGNAATRIVTYPASGSAVIVVNNLSYVAIRNLTVNNTVTAGTNCAGISIVGTNLAYNGTGCSIVGCTVNVPNPGGTSSTGYGITVTGTANGAGTTPGIGADSITIDSNTITGSAYGIVCVGSSSTTYDRAYRIRYNRVMSANYMGAYIYTIYNSIDFMNNYIHMNSSYGYYGVYFYSNISSQTVWPHRVNNNTVDNFGGYGIYFYNPGGTATAPAQLYNNLILNYGSSYGGYYGVYNSSGSYVEAYHNTIIMQNAGSSTSYTCFYNGVTNVWIKNNIFGVTSGSYSPVYCSTSPTANQINYNNYYNTTSNNNLGYRSGSWTSSNYRTNTALGDSSFNFVPNYSNPSAGNYALASNCGASGVDLVSTGYTYTVGHDSVDITGITRTNPPTVGAYQFNGTANDMAVVGIMSPVFPISSGSQPIKVKLANTGTTTIYSTTMWYKLNGGTPVSATWTGTLVPCGYDSITFTGVTLATGNNTLKIYSSLPNSSVDGNRNNDTINSSLGTPMSGTYTVNWNSATSGTNYQTFEAAIADLNNRGVSGACLFNVASGTYNPAGGSLTIGATGSLGVSATNTITFKSAAGVPDSVVVNGNGGGYIVTYNGTSYVNFNSISFVQLTGAGVFNFTGNANNDVVYNCKMTAPISTSGYMVNMTSGLTNNCTIRKCNIYGGYYGVYLYNSTQWNYNLTIDSNIIGHEYVPAYLYYSTNLKFNNNTVTMGDGPYTYGYLYMIYCDSATEFGNNNITTPNSGSYGYIYTAYYSVGNSTQHILYHNNKIDASGSGSYIMAYYPGYYGQYVDFYNNSWNLGASGYMYYLGYYSQNVRFYNNTVVSGYSSYSVYYYNSGTSYEDIQNNVFYNTGAGNAFYYAGASPSTTETLDNNNYYSVSNSTPIYGYTGSYTVSQWKSLTANTAVLRDKNSLTYYPGFTNTTSGSVNLAPNLSDSSIWSLNGRGKPVSWITNDLAGNSRSTSVLTGSTDIGCYEFTPSAGVLPPLATPSAAPTAGGTQVFTFGGDQVASITYPSLVTVPTAVGVRVYPQSTPPQLGTLNSAWQYTSAYWNVTAYPAGSYSWNPTITYKDQWLKNVPSKTTMVYAAKYTGSSWTAGLVSTGNVIDTVNNLLSPTATSITSNITNAYLVGTTASNPLPVQLDKIGAIRQGNNGLVTWTTASEVNSDYFTILRSFDGVNFTEEGTVHAAGNSVTPNTYTFTDVNVVLNNPTVNTIYYRLRMVDLDGSATLSAIATIKISNTLNVGTTVYPNPFTNELNVTVNATKNATARIEILDIQGRVVAVKSVDVIKGDTKVSISELSNLNAGIYFVNMTMNGETVHSKVIKN